MTIVFHEISPDAADVALERGLLQGTSGEKTDNDITETDLFLNGQRPQHLIDKGIDRQKNLYCYLTRAGRIIDINTGKSVPVPSFTSGRYPTLLKIEVDPARCYVSDLDLYDQIMGLLKRRDKRNATHLTEVYWSNLQQLDNYDRTFHRPEVMVTYDIEPNAITKVA